MNWDSKIINWIMGWFETLLPIVKTLTFYKSTTWNYQGGTSDYMVFDVNRVERIGNMVNVQISASMKLRYPALAYELFTLPCANPADKGYNLMPKLATNGVIKITPRIKRTYDIPATFQLKNFGTRFSIINEGIQLEPGDYVTIDFSYPCEDNRGIIGGGQRLKALSILTYSIYSTLRKWGVPNVKLDQHNTAVDSQDNKCDIEIYSNIKRIKRWLEIYKICRWIIQGDARKTYWERASGCEREFIPIRSNCASNIPKHRDCNININDINNKCRKQCGNIRQRKCKIYICLLADKRIYQQSHIQAYFGRHLEVTPSDWGCVA